MCAAGRCGFTEKPLHFVSLRHAINDTTTNERTNERRGRSQRGGARLKVLQRIAWIHSWREVIAPRDSVPLRCTERTLFPPLFNHSRYLSLRRHRQRLRAPCTTSNLPRRVGPTRFPSLPHPSRNEQRAISLLLNACHKSPRVPSAPLPPCPSVSTYHPIPSSSLSAFLFFSLSLSLVPSTTFVLSPPSLFSTFPLRVRTKQHREPPPSSLHRRVSFLLAHDLAAPVAPRTRSFRVCEVGSRRLEEVRVTEGSGRGVGGERDTERPFLQSRCLRRNNEEPVFSGSFRAAATFRPRPNLPFLLSALVEIGQRRGKKSGYLRHGTRTRADGKQRRRSLGDLRSHPRAAFVAAFFAGEIVVRRFIYARSVKFAEAAAPTSR